MGTSSCLFKPEQGASPTPFFPTNNNIKYNNSIPNTAQDGKKKQPTPKYGYDWDQ